MKFKGLKLAILMFSYFLANIQISYPQQIVPIETDTFRIESLDIGYKGPGIEFFTAIVQNKTNQTQILGLDLQADPGFCLQRMQHGFAFGFAPFEKKQIEAAYIFKQISSEAFVRVRMGIAKASNLYFDISNRFYEKKYFINDTAHSFDLNNFTRKETDHFRIYCYKNSPSETEINKIAEDRETGFRKISDLLRTTVRDKIILMFYPNAEIKTRETGHTGSGLASGNYIVEIYNDSIKLNPFHETAHIIAGELGEPPALFNEGFAVYISEALGGDSMDSPSTPGKKINNVTADNFNNNNLIPLANLFKFAEIGSVESQYAIAYPEAGSFIKFIIEKYGIDKFLETYKSLENSYDPIISNNNRKRFEGIYNISLTDIEQQWLSSLK
jgi:hypothetical protein